MRGRSAYQVRGPSLSNGQQITDTPHASQELVAQWCQLPSQVADVHINGALKRGRFALVQRGRDFIA